MAELRVRRRGLLQGAAAAFGVSAAGVLAGCSVAGRSAQPTKGPAPIVIQFAPWSQWTEIGSDWQKFIQPGLDYFESQNKGIRVQLVAPGGLGGAFASQIQGGTGPDVFEDWATAAFLNRHLVLNLNKYLQQEGLKTSLWSPGQMHALTVNGDVYFLPCYVHVDCLAVNLSNLDAMGLPYPDPTEWDYQTALKAYQAATQTVNGKQFWGLAPEFQGSAIGESYSDTRSYALHAFGGSLMDDTRLVCTIDSPQSVQAVQWWLQLYWDGVARQGSITNGATYQEYGSNVLLQAFENWGTSFKWTFFPVPKYPAGRVSFEATDFHAINAGTKHPDQAWLLLKFLSADPYWSRYTMKYLLRTPSLVSLWEEYVSVLEQVTPLAQKVQVKYYAEAAQSWGLAGQMFQYEHAQAIAIINTGLQQAMNAKGENPAPFLQAAAKQVNALEQSAAQLAAKASSASASGSSSAASSASTAGSSSSAAKASVS